MDVNQDIAELNRRCLALVEAFGLDASRIPADDGFRLHRLDGGVTFRTLDGIFDFHGDELTEGQRQALTEFVNPKPAPQRPTWRDVFRAMRVKGYRLKVEERGARYRKWWVDEGTGGIIAEIQRQVLGGRLTWDVLLHGYGAWSTYLSDPEPADVLAAAMLLGNIEGPVRGVQVTGVSGFPRNQRKHEIK